MLTIHRPAKLGGTTAHADALVKMLGEIDPTLIPDTVREIAERSVVWDQQRPKLGRDAGDALDAWRTAAAQTGLPPDTHALAQALALESIAGKLADNYRRAWDRVVGGIVPALAAHGDTITLGLRDHAETAWAGFTDALDELGAAQSEKDLLDVAGAAESYRSAGSAATRWKACRTARAQLDKIVGYQSRVPEWALLYARPEAVANQGTLPNDPIPHWRELRRRAEAGRWWIPTQSEVMATWAEQPLSV